MLFCRSLAFNVYLYTLTVGLALVGLPTLLMSRTAVTWTMALWARMVNTGLRAICGIHVEIRGREYLPDGPVLIAAKHQSMWDTIVFLDLLPNLVYVLKRELRFIPVYGWYTVRAGMIGVDRDAHASALRKLVKDAKARLAELRPILIFPEGTRMTPGEEADYKPGIAALYTQLNVACVPVAVNSGLYWPRRQFLRPPGTIILEFLPQIPAGMKRREFMATLENRIETATDKLVTEGRQADFSDTLAADEQKSPAGAE